jgi:hypothetical protein
MKSINELTVEEVKDWETLADTGDGWWPARPIGYYGGLNRRFKLAWKVFTGKADVLVWHKQ